MSSVSMWTPVLEPRRASITEFVDSWSRLYHYPMESIYTENIGLPLTPERIEELFKWKNGGKIAAKKAQSIRDNYYEAPRKLDAVGESAGVESLLRAIGGGGVVWGIFMLHIWRPNRFPIFDQHVHRATRLITDREAEELDKLRDPVKISRYADEYMPFWSEFVSGRDCREVDKALWAFGKAMKESNGSDLNWLELFTGQGELL